MYLLGQVRELRERVRSQLPVFPVVAVELLGLPGPGVGLGGGDVAGVGDEHVVDHATVAPGDPESWYVSGFAHSTKTVSEA